MVLLRADRRRGARLRLSLAGLALLLGLTTALPTSGQTVIGHVVDASTSSAVPGALIRLVNPDSTVLATTIADTSGAYELSAPGPGTFHVLAERFGYQSLLTPLLSTGNADGVYAVDLELFVDPIAMEGIVVTVERQARVLASVRRIVGINPRSLSREPILRDAIYSHVERGHSVSDMIRWAPGLHLVVRQEEDGPCFLLRGLYCLPVFLDGDRLLRSVVELIPLDMVDTAVVLTPNESIQYAGGAILLFTRGWLR